MSDDHQFSYEDVLAALPRLYASHAALLVAAKATAFWLQKTPLPPTLETSLKELQAAIAAAEEPAP